MTPEEMLGNYYRVVKKIEWLEADAWQLETEIDELTEKVNQERCVGLEIITSRRLVAASGGEPGCGAPRGIDDAYIIYEAQITKLEKELLKKRTLRLQKEEQIRELRDKTEPMRRIIEEMEPDEQEIVEMAYRDNLSNRHIAIELNCDERTVRRKRDVIVETILTKCRTCAALAPHFTQYFMVQ